MPVHVPLSASMGGQKTAFRGPVLFCLVWTLGMELRTSHLMAGAGISVTPAVLRLFLQGWFLDKSKIIIS